jgi:O-antigen/teichoic acid export membrane protein
VLIRDSIIYIASRGVPGLVGFATAILLTWLLPTDEYGIYGLGMAAVMLGNSLLFEWLGHGVARWYPGQGPDGHLMPTVLVLFAGTCFASALLLAGITALGLLGGHVTLAWILLYGSWAYGWYELAGRVQVCRFRPVGYLAMSLARSALIFAGTLLLAFLTKSGEAVLLVAFTAMLVAGCVARITADVSMRDGFDPALARSLAVYGAPILVTMVFSGLMTSVNPVLIGALSTKQAVAGFTISFTLVQATLLVIAYGIGSATWPFAVRAVDSGDPMVARAQLSRNFALLLGLVLPAGVGLGLLAPSFARVLINPAYYEAVVHTTPWLSVCAVLMVVRSLYVDSAFQLGRRTSLLAQVTALGALVNVTLAVALIPRWGELGAAIAMTCAAAVSLVYSSLLAARTYPMPIPLRATLAIVLATCCMAAAIMAAPASAGPAGLLLEVGLGAFVYAGALALLERLGLLPETAFLASLRHLRSGTRRPAEHLSRARDLPAAGTPSLGRGDVQ